MTLAWSCAEPAAVEMLGKVRKERCPCRGAGEIGAQEADDGESLPGVEVEVEAEVEDEVHPKVKMKSRAKKKVKAKAKVGVEVGMKVTVKAQAVNHEEEGWSTAGGSSL